MSYVRWEVVPSTRRRDGESPVAELDRSAESSYLASSLRTAESSVS